MRFDAYRGRQRSEARFANGFEAKFGTPDKTVVAWGDWSQGQGMRCNAPVPGKRMRDVLRKRGYRVALLDEFGTSTTCYLCQHPSKTCAPFRMCENPRPYQREAHPERTPRCSVTG